MLVFTLGVIVPARRHASTVERLKDRIGGESQVMVTFNSKSMTTSSTTYSIVLQFLF